MSAEVDTSLYLSMTDALRACIDNVTSGSALNDEQKQRLLAAREADRISLELLQLLRTAVKQSDTSSTGGGDQDGVMCELLKGSRVLAAKKEPEPVNPELEKRREYLRARQEQREYNAMVADIAPTMQQKENFASYKQQLNVGLNIIVSMAVMYIVCYYAGGGIFREEWQKMLCGLTGMVAIILVETTLFVVREYETKSYKQDKEVLASLGINAVPPQQTAATS